MSKPSLMICKIIAELRATLVGAFPLRSYRSHMLRQSLSSRDLAFCSRATVKAFREIMLGLIQISWLDRRYVSPSKR